MNRLEVLKDLLTVYIGDVTPTGNHALDVDREENLILLIDTVFYLEYVLQEVAGLKKTHKKSHNVIIHRAQRALQAIHDTLNESASYNINKNTNEYIFSLRWSNGATEEFLFKKIGNTWISTSAILDKEDWIIKDCEDASVVADALVQEDSLLVSISIYENDNDKALVLWKKVV